MPYNLEMEEIPVKYLKGYPSLAAFIASDSYHNTAIFRRFHRPSARNLLQLQSDLMELEAQQDALDAEDLQASTRDKDGTRNWQILKDRADETNNSREKKRLRVALEIRSKLREYREAIIFESAVLSMKKPSPRTLDAFRNYFNNVNPHKEPYPMLGGHDARILNDTGDLVSLCQPLNEDRLTRFIRHYFAFILVKRREGPQLAYLLERRLHMIVAVINVILVAVLLFGAICNLYHVTDEEKRLGLIAGYTATFAICVDLMTNARKAEVFASCAAYAAVLVVFISGNLGRRGSDSTGTAGLT